MDSINSIDSIIRKLRQSDRKRVIEMMRTFYATPAVFTNGSEEIFERDFQNCVSDCPYIEGYIFEENGVAFGYAMVAKSFSTELGRECVWLEDIYVKPEYRGKGLGGAFIEYIKAEYPGCVVRLEVERENARALHVYKSHGFEELPYTEMVWCSGI